MFLFVSNAFAFSEWQREHAFLALAGAITCDTLLIVTGGSSSGARQEKEEEKVASGLVA